MRRLAISWLLVACGSHHANGLDASAGDASADANAARGPIYLRVMDSANFGPAPAGSPVLISDPDGSIFEIVTTDPFGIATGHVLPGGSVTALPQANRNPSLWTVLAVQPGEHIILGPVPDGPPASTQGHSVNVAFPFPYNDPAGAGYAVYTPCGRKDFATQSPVAVLLDQPCDPMQAIAIATGGTGSLASAWTPSLPFGDGMTLATQPAWIAADQFTIDFANVHAGLSQLGLSRAAGLPTIAASTVSAGVAAPATGDVSLAMPLVHAPAAMIAVVANAPTDQQQLFVERIDPALASLRIDVSNDLLPWVGPIRFDPSTTTLQVIAASAQPPTLVAVTLADSRSYQWSIFGPFAGDIALPQVPAADLPAASGQISATVCATDGIAGYAEARLSTSTSMAICQGGLGAPGTRWLESTAEGAYP